MLEFFGFSRELSDSWAFWGVFLLVVFPALAVVLNEFVQRLETNGNAYAEPMSQVKNAILPTLFIFILLRQVIGYESTHIISRVVETLFWVFVINTSLAFMNIAIYQAAESGGRSARVPKLFLDLLRVFLVMIGGAFVVSTVWEVNLGGLLTALGVGSVVIGLALQDTLGGLFSGLALISARNFKVGDWIRVGDIEGNIMAMDWRSMTLRHRDGDLIVLPNTVLAKERIRNYLAATGSHVEIFHFELSYDHPPELVKQLLVETARDTKGVIENPPPEGRVVDYTDYAVKYEARLFVDDYGPVPIIRTEFQSLFWYTAQRNGLIFPARFNKFYEVPDLFRPRRYETADDITRLLTELDALPVPPEKLELLARHSRFLRFRKGEKLMEQGEVCLQIFVMVEGRAEASLQDVTDEEHAVHSFDEGQVIAFKSMLQQAPGHVGILAKTDVAVVAIEVAAVQAILATEFRLSEKFEDMLSANEDAIIRMTRSHITGDLRKTGEEGERLEILKDIFRLK